MFAVVEENFSTRTTRTGIAHLPEVVRGVTGAFVVTDADDFLRRQTDFFIPDVVRFIVFGVHSHHQFLNRQVQPLLRSQKLPGEMNGVIFEVIAKAEVTQHFEEGVMTGGVTDVFQVVVLTTGAHAAL